MGTFLEESFSLHSTERTYKVHIPSGYHGQPLPLMVMLHGCSQDPDDFARGTRMNALADEHSFFVLYPRQPRSANVSKCWNWFVAANQRRDSGEPALIVGMTRAVIQA